MILDKLIQSRIIVINYPLAFLSLIGVNPLLSFRIRNFRSPNRKHLIGIQNVFVATRIQNPHERTNALVELHIFPQGCTGHRTIHTVMVIPRIRTGYTDGCGG